MIIHTTGNNYEKLMYTYNIIILYVPPIIIIILQCAISSLKRRISQYNNTIITY